MKKKTENYKAFLHDNFWMKTWRKADVPHWNKLELHLANLSYVQVVIGNYLIHVNLWIQNKYEKSQSITTKIFERTK